MNTCYQIRFLVTVHGTQRLDGFTKRIFDKVCGSLIVRRRIQEASLNQSTDFFTSVGRTNECGRNEQGVFLVQTLLNAGRLQESVAVSRREVFCIAGQFFIQVFDDGSITGSGREVRLQTKVSGQELDINETFSRWYFEK